MSAENNQFHLPAQMLPVSHANGATTEIATIWHAGSGPFRPTIMWLSGFNSDMRGGKAISLAEWCGWHDYGFLSLDYSGHGESGGRFEDGTIGDWLAQARAVLEWADPARFVIVGSSMGGWIAMLLMRQLMAEDPERAKRAIGMVLIAPAWNMTERIWNALPDEARAQIENEGQFIRPSAYEETGYPITRKLIEQGARYLVPPDAPIDAGAPVRIIQGMHDEDVPWHDSLELFQRLTQEDAHLHLVRDGEHRLSRPQDIHLIFNAVRHVLETLTDS